jgi:hypothetical protein
VLAGCTIYEGLQVQNITMTMCGAPVRDKHLRTVVISLTGGALALMAFIMRLCTLFLRKTGRSAGADDYMAGAALLLAGPPTLTCFTCMLRYPTKCRTESFLLTTVDTVRDNGLGKDIWTLELDQIKKVLQVRYFEKQIEFKHHVPLLTKRVE